MTTGYFSYLSNGVTYLFDPTDKLIFDDPRVSASEVFIDYQTSPDHVYLTSVLENKKIGLETPVATLTSANIRFSDGSVLRVGDNNAGTANDNGNNKLTGGAGDDHLIGLGGNDTLTGGAGNDYLEGGEGNDRLVGGDGVEFFFDFYGSNTFSGGAGNDFFFALPSFDTVGGGASNLASGGTGRDTYYISAGFPGFPVNFSVTDFAEVGAGDFINISSALTTGAFQGYYQGQHPVSGGFVRVLQSGPDALVQSDLDGAGGVLFGFTTVLTLKNTVATSAAATITGYVLGSTGNDVLTGDSSNQMLFAAAGHDVLNGGKGADNMFGGSGSDTYHVDDGSDVVSESSNAPGALVIGPGDGHAGLDGITDTVLAAVTYSLENAQFAENLRLTGTVARQATGNALDNSITGNALNNLLVGLGGNDTLSGAAGNDALYGGEGNDRMIWGAGDTLNGEAGTDTLKITAGSLKLTTLSNTAILGVEQIDMTGAGINVLTLSRNDVLALSSETDTLLVLGSAGDKVDIVGSFTAGAPSGGFRTYNLGGGALLTVETDVAVI